MIEWTEIKNWKFEDDQACVICYKMNGKPWFAFINSQKAVDRYNRDGKTITHIATLNLPVEKTLEEKFEDTLPKSGEVYNTRALARRLAQITKQHYEEEK